MCSKFRVAMLLKKKTFREGARETQRKGERARDDDDSRLALSFPPH